MLAGTDPLKKKKFQLFICEEKTASKREVTQYRVSMLMVSQGFLQLDDVDGQHDPHLRITGDPHETLEGPRSGELRMQKLEVPSIENTEFKGSPLKAWSSSLHCYTCYAYREEFLPC